MQQRLSSARSPRQRPGSVSGPESLLVLACGALGRELHSLKVANHWRHMTIRCLDARLHLRPTEIAPRLRQEIERARPRHSRIFVAYADCGSYGAIDRLLADYPDITRLPGLHCYQFFAGEAVFDRLMAEAPGTFFLTDFLVRFFDQFVVQALRLETHPELIDAFFGNYSRLVYLSQTEAPELEARARQAAEFLGLAFEQVHTGYGGLARGVSEQIVAVAGRQPALGRLG